MVLSNSIVSDFQSAVKALVSFTNCYAYYVALFLFSLVTWLDRTILFHNNLASLFTLIEATGQIAALLLLGLVGLQQRASVGEWAKVLCVLLVSFISWRCSGEGWFFWIAVFVVFGKGVSIKRAAITMMAVSGVVLACSLVPALLGLVHNVSVVDVRDGASQLRMCLGFTHPNFFGAFLLMLCAAVCVVSLEEKPVHSCIVCGLGAVLAWTIASSRTSAVCMLLLTVFIACFQGAIKLGKEKFLKVAFFAFFCFAAVLSFVLLVAYGPDNELMARLNALLTGRLNLAHRAFQEHSPSLFGFSYAGGTVVTIAGKEYTFVVDNMYDHILLRFGIIAWAIFMAAVVAFYAKCLRGSRCASVLPLFTMFMIFGFAETLGCRVECNFLVVSLAGVLYKTPSYLLEELNLESAVENGNEIRLFELPKTIAKKPTTVKR